MRAICRAVFVLFLIGSGNAGSGWASLGRVAGAAPGDTLEVRTFTFDSLTTRRAVFDFPDDERRWERIWMRHTLRCDEATAGDPYPCGEWDVTTHTTVNVHTGRQDSTRHESPYFEVDGETPDAFAYRRAPGYDEYSYWEVPADPATRHGTYLLFDGADYLRLPPDILATTDSALTISCWMRGSDAQPVADHLLEAQERGGRVLNIHLPWNTGQVFFDAGGRLAGNNNRLSKPAAPDAYRGRWNHWAFTKDVARGVMRIYLNGHLWHEAGNMVKAMPRPDSFVLGANGSGQGGFFSGAIDDLRVWDTALTEEQIRAWMHRPVDERHPAYGHLRAEYRFEQDTGTRIADQSPHGFDALAVGQPQPLPFGTRGRGDWKPGPQMRLVTERVPGERFTVWLHDDPAEPTRVTDTLHVWAAQDRYFDGNGTLLEARPAAEADTLHQVWHATYGPAFEVIEPFEIARFITPYGKGLDLGADGFTWIQEVTDYAPLLRGPVDLQAGNQLELLDLTFLFIEGLPARDVLAIENLWPLDSYRYSDLSDDRVLTSRTCVLSPDGRGFAVRSRISGHGHAGPRHCCEWDAKEHRLYVKGLPEFLWTVWTDCGLNPVHPQGGTWQFDRAGWCPGRFVDTAVHELSPLVRSAETVALDYAIEPADAALGEGDGQFIQCHQLFTYGPLRRDLDLSLDAIVAPSKADEVRRFNPRAITPLIRLRNLGRTAVTRAMLEYGLSGGQQHHFAWEGRLEFSEQVEVTLPKPAWAGMRDGARFLVRIVEVNGRPDDHPGNDQQVSHVPAPVVLPGEFCLHLRSSGFERAAENRVVIRDASGAVVAEYAAFADDRENIQPVELAPGAYELTCYDTAEDGLIRHWWLRGSDPDRIGENGRLELRDVAGDLLYDFGYDFAERASLQFFVGPPR